MQLARRTRQLMIKCFDFLNLCTCHRQMLSSSNHHYFDEVSINKTSRYKLHEMILVDSLTASYIGIQYD
jgi:hypothetical protein